jgi:predicted secreted protein
MGKKLGNDYLLWIESTTPGTYNLIKGQQALNLTRSASVIDTATKDDFPYGTSAPGLRQVSISLTAIPNLPDATGYTRFETLCNAAPAAPFNIQIRKNGATGATPGDVVFAALMYGNIDSTGFAQNDSVKITAKLDLAAAPSTDILG